MEGSIHVDSFALKKKKPQNSKSVAVISGKELNIYRPRVLISILMPEFAKDIFRLFIGDDQQFR